MKIIFDTTKDQLNQLKHGVSLREASRLIWNEALIAVDDRSNYGELREVGYVPLDDRLYSVVFTRRVDGLLIISLRKANQREIKFYADQN